MADQENSSTEESSEQLDRLIVDYFQTLADIFNSKQLLENDMKDGFLYMAKARYTMGKERVSKLQYDDRDLGCALVHVDINQSSDSDHSFTPHVDSLQRTTAASAKKESAAEETESSEDNSGPVDLASGLRKRNVVSSEGVRVSSGSGDKKSLVEEMKKLMLSGKKMEKKKNDGDCKSVATRDPLYWFGILVPMPLKQSQAAFRRAIDVVCKIATLQTQLLDIRDRYQAALKAKRRLSFPASVVEDS